MPQPIRGGDIIMAAFLRGLSCCGTGLLSPSASTMLLFNVYKCSFTFSPVFYVLNIFLQMLHIILALLLLFMSMKFSNVCHKLRKLHLDQTKFLTGFFKHCALELTPINTHVNLSPNKGKPPQLWKKGYNNSCTQGSKS